MISGSLTITDGVVIVDNVVIGGMAYLARIKELQFGCWLPEYRSRWASLR